MELIESGPEPTRNESTSPTKDQESNQKDDVFRFEPMVKKSQLDEALYLADVRLKEITDLTN